MCYGLLRHVAHVAKSRRASHSGAPVKIAVGEPKSLYLIVRAPQQGYWVGQFRDHTNGGKFQTKGLGRAPDVTLKAARDAWEADRAARRSAVPAVQVASAATAKPVPAGQTFGEAAGEYIAAMATRYGWRDRKDRALVRGRRPVAAGRPHMAGNH